MPIREKDKVMNLFVDKISDTTEHNHQNKETKEERCRNKKQEGHIDIKQGDVDQQEIHKDKKGGDGDKIKEGHIDNEEGDGDNQEKHTDNKQEGQSEDFATWQGRKFIEQVKDPTLGKLENVSDINKMVNDVKTQLIEFPNQQKITKIQEVLSSNPLDLETLRSLATSNFGLVTDDLRKKAWPKLMMVELIESTPKPSLEIVKSHKEYQQVVLDVNRTLKRFPPGIDDEYRVILMEQLTTLIIRILYKHPELHYYQGYHDVAITFLLVMGEDVGFELVEKLSVTHLSEFMRPTMDRTTYYLLYLYPILKRADSQLCQFLLDSGVGTVFCLPWLITWFAHTLSDYRNVVRLYDFFLASPYLMPMYIAAAIVIERKSEILAAECEMAMQHFILSKVPDTLPFENILVEADKLYRLYPPDTLQQEVNELLEKRNLDEAQEKKKGEERRKKYIAAKKWQKWTGVLAALAYYVPLAPIYKKTAFRVAAFAITVYLATSFYGYYSNSSEIFPFLPKKF